MTLNVFPFSATRKKLFEIARTFSEKTKRRKSKRRMLLKHQSYPLLYVAHIIWLTFHFVVKLMFQSSKIATPYLLTYHVHMPFKKWKFNSLIQKIKAFYFDSKSYSINSWLEWRHPRHNVILFCLSAVSLFTACMSSESHMEESKILPPKDAFTPSKSWNIYIKHCHTLLIPLLLRFLLHTSPAMDQLRQTLICLSTSMNHDTDLVCKVTVLVFLMKTFQTGHSQLYSQSPWWCRRKPLW